MTRKFIRLFSLLLFINPSCFPFRYFLFFLSCFLCFLVLDAHNITELSSGKTCCSCRGFLSLDLLSSFSN